MLDLSPYITRHRAAAERYEAAVAELAAATTERDAALGELLAVLDLADQEPTP